MIKLANIPVMGPIAVLYSKRKINLGRSSKKKRLYNLNKLKISK